MKIILTQDVKNLGYKDDIVEVKDGFGRNFLVPSGNFTQVSKFPYLFMEKLSKDFTLVVSPLAAFKLFTKNKIVIKYKSFFI